jgi:hypothetical protein
MEENNANEDAIVIVRDRLIRYSKKLSMELIVVKILGVNLDMFVVLVE